MGDPDVFSIVVRWLHITGAIVAAGGAVFALVVVLPALHGVPEEARAGLHEAIRRRYAMLFHAAITALLLTGFYNYIALKAPEHKGQAAYHGLMGVKILLAFGVILLGSALTGRSAVFEAIRRRRKRYLALNVVLALAIVAIGAVLRAMPPGK
jgi:uncharacterized membrane protein